MKRLFFIILLLPVFHTYGQSLKDQVIEAGNLFLSGEYKKAIPVAEKAAATLRSQMGEENILYIGLLTIQASSYKFTFQYDLSEKIYLQLKPLILKVNGEDDESYTSY